MRAVQGRNRGALAVLSISSFAACGTPADDAKAPGWSVEHHGTLREIMHGGDLGARVHLNDLNRVPHLHALGALEGLRGEILVLDGSPVVSKVQDGSLAIDASFDNGAALLVRASVEHWEEHPLPETVRSPRDLEDFLGERAVAAGIDRDLPFPFRLDGRAARLDWHVIDWPDGDTEHTPEKHKTSGLHGTLREESVRILGFYSTSHQGVFTHHSSRVHMHFVTDSGSVAGHVDDLQPDRGMRLYLPRME